MQEADAAYHALVNSINAAETVDADGELVPFINYMNVNVRRYRIYIGQSLADMDSTSSSGSGSSGEEEYPTPPEGTHWNFTLADLNLAIGMKNPGDTITVRA